MKLENCCAIFFMIWVVKYRFPLSIWATNCNEAKRSLSPDGIRQISKLDINLKDTDLKVIMALGLVVIKMDLWIIGAPTQRWGSVVFSF